MADGREALSVPSPGEAASGWLRAVTDLLYPPVCAICARALLAPEKTVCLVCRAALNPEPEWQCPRCGASGTGEPPEPDKHCRLCPPSGAAYQGIFTVTGYFAEPARAVHLFKYHRRLELGNVMADAMSGRLNSPLRQLGRRIDCVAPVPLHWLRRAERGFNQSVLLARAVARAADLRLDERLLRRTRHTKRQALVPHDLRAANVRDAFALRRGRDVRGRGVLLVDDVVTTGHTIQECAKSLRNAGAREVWVACFARAGTGLGKMDED